MQYYADFGGNFFHKIKPLSGFKQAQNHDSKNRYYAAADRADESPFYRLHRPGKIKIRRTRKNNRGKRKKKAPPFYERIILHFYCSRQECQGENPGQGNLTDLVEKHGGLAPFPDDEPFRNKVAVGKIQIQCRYGSSKNKIKCRNES